MRYALAEIARGLVPSNKVITPRVLSWEAYCKRRGLDVRTGQLRPEPNGSWDKVRQCIGLDAEFYEGGELLLFPPLWLDRCEELARQLRGKKRVAKALGCDPGEGGANTAWSIVDEYGLIEQESFPTPDTSLIPNHTIALGKKWNIPDDYWVFDRGGGGKQAADTLRSRGYRGVRTVAFGEAITLPVKRSRTQFVERFDQSEDRYTYINRRAEMYGELSVLCDPATAEVALADSPMKGDRWQGFAIPEEYRELRRQLAIMPKLTDNEGRYYLPPKNKKDPNSKVKTLCEMLGGSPDEADSLVVAVHGMLHKPQRAVAGVA